MYIDIVCKCLADTLPTADECWFCLSNPKLAYVRRVFHVLDLILIRGLGSIFWFRLERNVTLH